LLCSVKENKKEEDEEEEEEEGNEKEKKIGAKQNRVEQSRGREKRSSNRSLYC
jgi:hypothetical protein